MSASRTTRSGPEALAACLVLVLCGASALHAPARACGHCVEDKVAATYDYALLVECAAHGHVVVFADLVGPLSPADPRLAPSLAAQLAAIGGVDRGSVRVSIQPSAAAFACDPARHAPAALLAAMNERLASRHLHLALLKIDAGPHPGPRAQASTRTSAAAFAARP